MKTKVKILKKRIEVIRKAIECDGNYETIISNELIKNNYNCREIFTLDYAFDT